MANGTDPRERRTAVRESHAAFGLFLLFLGLVTLAVLGAYGWSYYLTPLELRPFHRDYAILKPSGSFGHGTWGQFVPTNRHSGFRLFRVRSQSSAADTQMSS